MKGKKPHTGGKGSFLWDLHFGISPEHLTEVGTSCSWYKPRKLYCVPHWLCSQDTGCWLVTLGLGTTLTKATGRWLMDLKQIWIRPVVCRWRWNQNFTFDFNITVPLMWCCHLRHWRWTFLALYVEGSNYKDVIALERGPSISVERHYTGYIPMS